MKKLILCVSILCLLAVNANATLYRIDKDPGHTLYGNLNQNNIPAPLGGVACGPTAAVNSFVYLERKYPSVYNRSLIPDLNGDGLYQQNELIPVAQVLAGVNFMNTLLPPSPPNPYTGTRHDDFIWGKHAYIEQQVPGVTTYVAQDQWPWNNAARPQPSWVTSMSPIWQFIWNELVACADLEILLSWTGGGHYLTVKSFDWDDTHNFGVIDFDEDAMFDYIDPCTGLPGVSKLWQNTYGGILETNYNASTITMAVSEIPEPCTILLLGLGGLLLRKRKK